MPCALIFHSTHCISDQTSANMLVDQLLRDIDTIERKGDESNDVAVPQDMPMSVEDSVLGIGGRYSDIGTGGMSIGTLGYVAGTRRCVDNFLYCLFSFVFFPLVRSFVDAIPN